MNFKEYSQDINNLTQIEEELNNQLTTIHQTKADLHNKAFEEHLFQVSMYDLISELAKTRTINFDSSHITFSKNGKHFSLPEKVFNSHYCLMQSIIEKEKPHIYIFLDIKGSERPTILRRPLRATDTLSDGEYIAKKMRPGNITTTGDIIPHLNEADSLKLTYNFHPRELMEDQLLCKAVIACVKRKEAHKEQLQTKKS